MKFVDLATLEIAIGLPRLIKVDLTQLNAEDLFDVLKNTRLIIKFLFQIFYQFLVTTPQSWLVISNLSKLKFGKKIHQLISFLAFVTSLL